MRRPARRLSRKVICQSTFRDGLARLRRGGSGKALVFGPYPPLPGPGAAATLASVRRLLAEGLDVTVVSPRPSGAHHHADPGRSMGALRLARWVLSAGRVVLHLDPGVLLGAWEGRRLPPGRLAVGTALCRAGDVEIHLEPIRGAIDARSVSVVLGPAGRVVVASPADRDTLVRAGLDPGNIEVAPIAETAPPPRFEGGPVPADAGDPGPWNLEGEPGREELQAEIRRRAALRRGGGVAVERDRDFPGTAASRPLLAIAPLGPAPARSGKPGVGFVKRVVRRLVGWQIDPVIEHVNRLHRATVEAIENQEPPTR